MNEVKTINIRFKYRKTGVFKYLSHLDMLTILARTVSRSGLKVKFSAGFNPKQKLLLSNPIQLGVESRAEYCDIELVEDIDIEKFKDLMNKNLPRPLEVSDAIKINKKIPSVMSQIDLVCYDFEIELKNQNKHDPCIQIPSGTKLTSEGLPRSSPETMHMILSKMNLPPGNFADSIYRYEILPVKNNIFLLKILGYAKILKGESKSIFCITVFSAGCSLWQKFIIL